MTPPRLLRLSENVRDRVLRSRKPAERLIEVHGGVIGARHRSQSGADFHLTLLIENTL